MRGAARGELFDNFVAQTDPLLNGRRDMSDHPFPQLVCALSALPAQIGDAKPLALLRRYAEIGLRHTDVFGAGSDDGLEDEDETAAAERDRIAAALDAEQNALFRELTNEAPSSLTIAVKLIMWRWDMMRDGEMPQNSGDVFAFAAYQDALRMSGLESLAHPDDVRLAAAAKDCTI